MVRDIGAVCFDFDGTLAHFAGDFGAFVAGLRTDLGVTQCDTNGFAAQLSASLRQEGAVTLRSALAETLGALEQTLPGDLEEIVAHAVKTYSAQVALLPGAREVLEGCEQRGLPLALISNGPDDMQRAAVRALGLVRFFRSVLISGDRDVGVRKPEARIFGLACTGLETVPERVLMVGDDLKADVGGALAYGMQAVYLGEADEPGEASPKDFDAVPDLFVLQRYLETRL